MRGLRDFPATLSSEEEELDLVQSPALYPLHHRPFQTSTVLNSPRNWSLGLLLKGWRSLQQILGLLHYFYPQVSGILTTFQLIAAVRDRAHWRGESVSYIREICLQKQQAQNLFFNSCDFIKQLYLAAPWNSCAHSVQCFETENRTLWGF